MKKLIAPLFFCLAFLSISCKKKDNPYPDIPYVKVDIYLQLRLPQYSALNSIGNNVSIAGGYKGIIVFRKSLDEYAAYEQACPYDPTHSNSLIEVEADGIQASDQNCGSKFNLFDGSVINGPSTRPLKQYRTEYDSGTDALHIFN